MVLLVVLNIRFPKSGCVIVIKELNSAFFIILKEADKKSLRNIKQNVKGN